MFMVLMVGNSDLKRIDTMISWKYLKKIGLVTFNLGKKKIVLMSEFRAISLTCPLVSIVALII